VFNSLFKGLVYDIYDNNLILCELEVLKSQVRLFVCLYVLTHDELGRNVVIFLEKRVLKVSTLGLLDYFCSQKNRISHLLCLLS
jgi:hypothetical protein